LVRKISATDAARSFAEMINRVRYQGEHYEVIRNGEPVARIVPTIPARALTAAELSDMLRNLPPLDPGFADELSGSLAAPEENGQ